MSYVWFFFIRPTADILWFRLACWCMCSVLNILLIGQTTVLCASRRELTSSPPTTLKKKKEQISCIPLINELYCAVLLLLQSTCVCACKLFDFMENTLCSWGFVAACCLHNVTVGWQKSIKCQIVCVCFVAVALKYVCLCLYCLDGKYKWLAHMGLSVIIMLLAHCNRVGWQKSLKCQNCECALLL